jgi:hypothetical protein
LEAFKPVQMRRASTRYTDEQHRFSARRKQLRHDTCPDTRYPARVPHTIRRNSRQRWPIVAPTPPAETAAELPSFPEIAYSKIGQFLTRQIGTQRHRQAPHLTQFMALPAS